MFKTTKEIHCIFQTGETDSSKQWISKEEHLKLIKKAREEGYEACIKDTTE